MLGKVFLIGLIGAAAYGASRVMKSPAGAVESGASKAAAAIREKAPGGSRHRTSRSYNGKGCSEAPRASER